jgi:hypothetical protein
MTDWNLYLRQVISTIKNRKPPIQDAYEEMWHQKHIADQVMSYASRWADHQRYGLKTPEQFAESLGYYRS